MGAGAAAKEMLAVAKAARMAKARRGGARIMGGASERELGGWKAAPPAEQEAGRLVHYSHHSLVVTESVSLRCSPMLRVSALCADEM